MPKKMTKEDFQKKLDKLYGNEFLVIGEYVNSKTKIDVIHSKCGKTVNIKPNDLLNRGRCVYCTGGKRISHDEFVQQVFEAVGNEYEVIGKFEKKKSPVKMFHIECGNYFNPQPYEFLSQGTRCPHCDNKSRALGDFEFKRRVREATNDSYEVLGNYVNNHTNILMKHKECGQYFEPKPKTFLDGTRCPYCSGRRSNKETFEKKLKDVYGDEFVLVGEYIDSTMKVDLFHKKCKKVYSVEPIHLLGLQKRYCSHCQMSSPEAYVDRILSDYKIENKTQYKFEDCKNINPLPFDFAIFKEGELSLLMEVDGKQHFEPIEFFGGEEAFRKRKENDSIKNRYCKKKKIPLIRIPYWDFFNLEKVLNKILVEYNLIYQEGGKGYVF